MYHCDSECANYRSLKICSHTVAVAESNGDLAVFIELFTKKAKPPNITKLALHGMPSGRGRKVKQPPRKRVRKEPVESTVPFQPASITSTPGSTTTSSSTTTLSSSPAMSGLSSTSHDFAAPTAWMGMPSTSHFVSPIQLSHHFQAQFSLTLRLFLSVFRLRTPCPSLSQQQVLFMWFLFLETLVYAQGVIESITNQLKHRMICALGMRSGASLLPLVIHRSLQRRVGDAYYHPCYACIRSQWPYVQPGDISVDEIKEHLLPAHQMFLAEHLGLYV